MDNNRAFFDATADAATSDFLSELMRALSSIPEYEHGMMVSVHIPADGEDCERGEVIVDCLEPSRALADDDWYVVGTDPAKIAEKIYELTLSEAPTKPHPIIVD